MLSSLQSAFHSVRQSLTPTLKQSAFLEEGVLTAGEFVQAGEQLVRAQRTWKWEAGEPGKAKSFLPPDRQFLCVRGVPCRARVSTMVASAGRAEEVEGDWVAAVSGAGGVAGGHGAASSGGGGGGAGEDEYADISEATPAPDTGAAAASGGAAASAPAASAAPAAAASGDDGYEDLDDLVDPAVQALSLADTAAAPAAPAAALAGSSTSGSGSAATPAAGSASADRFYTMSLVYDNYYRTPRVYLKGYTSSGVPLTPEEMMSDVIQDYAQKTATLESHPHLPDAGPHISIHPCRHAETMKRILHNLVGGGSVGGEAQVSVEAYLFFFLKFIASMVPTLEYDYTVDVKV